MKCFIHHNKEAIAACKKCGKGMCEDCSAYSGHSGICPECRREDFIEDRIQLLNEAADYKKGMVMNVVWSVLLCWTVIALPWNAIAFVCKMRKRNAILAKANKLQEEITKLTAALDSGNAII